MPAIDKNIYPRASLTQWFATVYPGGVMPHPNVALLHSTEGTGWTSYGGGAVAPNFTACPNFAKKRMEFRQHFPANMSSRALENHAGGVETNTLNIVQIEIVGTCDPKTHRKWKRQGIRHLYMPRLPSWAIRDLGQWLAWLHGTYPIPLTSGVKWVAYPASYGNRKGQRMTDAQWLAFNGVCGHQHAPENVHGDPGKFPIKKLLAAAGGTHLADTSTPTAPKPKAWYEMSTLSNGVAGAIEKIGRKIANAFLTGIPAPSRFKDKVWGFWLYLKNTNDRAYNGGKYAWQSREAAKSAAASAARVEKLLEKFLAGGGKPLTEDEIKAASAEGTQEVLQRLASADAEVQVTFAVPQDVAADDAADETGDN